LSSRRRRFLAPMTTMSRTRPRRDTGRPYLSGIVPAAIGRECPAAVLPDLFIVNKFLSLFLRSTR
jgi:hypothetical protein